MKQNQYVGAYRLEQNLVHFLARHSLPILRVALGVIYLWFGALKFFPGLSPAEDLALRTIDTLTFGLLPAASAAVLLALLECTIGLGFLTGKYMRLTLLLMAFQMAGATSPLFLFPKETLGSILVAPTLEGQYIIKNLVLIGAALVIASTVRGGGALSPSHTSESGTFSIEPIELFRVFGAVNGHADSTVNGQQAIVDGSQQRESLVNTHVLMGEVESLRLRLADKEEVIADLRRRLDALTEAHTQLTAVIATLAPPQPRKGWWQRLLGS